MAVHHFRFIRPVIRFFHIPHVIQVETGRRPAKGFRESPLGISLPSDFHITAGSVQRTAVRIHSQITGCRCTLIIMNRTGLPDSYRLFASVQGTDHSLYIYIIKTVLEIPGKIYSCRKSVTNHKVFQIRLVQCPIDGCDHSSKQAISFPVFLYAGYCIVCQRLHDFNIFNPVTGHVGGRTSRYALHHAYCHSASVRPGQLQGTDDRNIVFAVCKTVDIVDSLWSI